MNDPVKVARRYGFSVNDVLHDIQSLQKNEPLREHIIELHGIDWRLAEMLAEERVEYVLPDVTRCPICGESYNDPLSIYKNRFRSGTTICLACDKDAGRFLFDFYVDAYRERIRETYTTTNIIFSARNYVRKHGTEDINPLTWQLGGDNGQKAYLFLQPRRFRMIYRQEMKRKAKIRIRSNKFEKHRANLMLLYKRYVDARHDANLAADEFMQKNAPKFQVAQIVDFWLYPTDERNKELLEALPSDEERQKIIKDADEIMDVVDWKKFEPKTDMDQIERSSRNLRKRSEKEAEEVAGYLRKYGDEMAIYGNIDECQELALVISEEFFLSDAGAEYYKDIVEPFLQNVSEGNRGASLNKFWAKVWPEFPTDEEMDDIKEKFKKVNERIKHACETPYWEKVESYYERFQTGLKILSSTSAPLGKLATIPSYDLPKERHKFYHGKAAKYLEGLVSKRCRMEITIDLKKTNPGVKGIPVKQLVVVGDVKKPKWLGKMAQQFDTVTGAIDNVLTPINLILTIHSISKGFDDKKMATLMSDIFGTARVAFKIDAIRRTFGISPKGAEAFGRFAGGVGGVAQAYVGVRDFQSDMSYMEMDKGICDLMVAAGGMFMVGGVATGGILSIFGFVLGLMGTVGKWLFADSPRQKFVKGTKYYHLWEDHVKDSGYMITSKRWQYFAVTHPTYEQIKSKDYWLGYRFRFEVIGAHDAVIYVKFYAYNAIAGIFNEKIKAYHKDTNTYSYDYFKINMVNGIGIIDIPQPFFKGGEKQKIIARLYHEVNNEYKDFDQSDPSYYEIENHGKRYRGDTD